MTQAREPLTDPVAMRALAHPARLAILNRLQVEGPATATEVAEVVGITPSAASYHLRMLAKYGFAEDAPPRGDGRERMWRGSSEKMSITREPEDRPEVRAAKDLLIKAVRDQAADEAARALSALDREPRHWRDASVFSRTILLVGAEELQEINRRIDELLAPYRITARDRAEAPADARVAEAQVNLFPRAVRRPHGLPRDA
ncbi:ArsR/SmtB family transcription factor [Streptosporangium saharense]|uniref:DNA-binding transcriptional ArsR family regulator n=1 Tax=Streptosporangium saharense TaxID=1706840 RepID=A0A7W7QJI9_9ACTN|nr:winged helix-turn-helix domain-containing protein [Streptosporangium saharense]MBB4914702.1 DNA-binding transcriptional ArsR family regulator [Streptosporangium saharense]